MYLLETNVVSELRRARPHVLPMDTAIWRSWATRSERQTHERTCAMRLIDYFDRGADLASVPADELIHVAKQSWAA